MIRCTILAMLLIVSPALAEPIPKESDTAKLKRVWGELVDSGGGAKVKLDGDKLRMTLPAGDRVVYNQRNNSHHAPYMMKTIRGDFVATVTVLRHSPPAEPGIGDRSNPLVASGLIAVFDVNTVTSYCRALMPNNSAYQLRSTFRYPQGSSMTSSGGGSPKNRNAESAKLRLTRKGESVKYEYSYDGGKTWQAFTVQTRATNDEAKVGVYAEHTVDAITDAYFEGFELKPLKDETKTP
jgi:hypothetical protein